VGVRFSTQRRYRRWWQCLRPRRRRPAKLPERRHNQSAHGLQGVGEGNLIVAETCSALLRQPPAGLTLDQRNHFFTRPHGKWQTPLIGVMIRNQGLDPLFQVQPTVLPADATKCGNPETAPAPDDLIRDSSKVWCHDLRLPQFWYWKDSVAWPGN
jgi:hypothetical protein